MTMIEGGRVPRVSEDSDLSIGDYVFASRWGDADPSDPWAVGFISEILNGGVRVVSETGDWIECVGQRVFPFAVKISGVVGGRICDQYPELEGSSGGVDVVAIWEGN